MSSVLQTIRVKIEHGKSRGYKLGCRCKDCTKANTEAMRRYRKSLQEKAS